MQRPLLVLALALALAAACSRDDRAPAAARPTGNPGPPAPGAGTPGPPSAAAAPSSADAPARRVEIRVTESGYEPAEVRVKRGEGVTLVFTRVAEHTCMTALDIPDEGVKGLELPLRKPVAVRVAPQKKGVEKFHCSAMGMGNGRIVVE